MKLPSRLTELLARNIELMGAVNLTLHDFLTWFQDRNMVFFPEYTDHGPKHIEEVITTAESLIKDESWRHLTSEDAAVLVISVLLHDCAMHLSEDGFVELVDSSRSRPIVPGFSEIPWPELWANFLGEASRFDARRLNALFGDTEPIHRPPLDAQQMTRRDRLLIGEFLRRHHTRLAHEIAYWGVPGPSAIKIALVKVPEGLAKLSGLIARSHGVDLRDIVETLPRIHRREHYKVHAPFLMSILRVADYIQIHSERAPTQVLSVRSLQSPISQGEWRAHESVAEINSTHDDPEALVVIARPKDVGTFLKLERLLSGLQRELDESWAVLGEVYGRVEGLRDLGLAIRRVRSNLDDKREFSKTVSYHPDRIVFDADPEILKLLIEPLYGDEGGIAVREFVQNAVDACLERRDYFKNVSPESSEDMKSDGADVTVQLDEDNSGGWLIVSDQGIGMTVDVIKNYFLKAGASYRRSDAWKDQHETPEGKPRIIRSGRFGIGVLAAFLLGDRVEVQTRHVSQSAAEGIEFSASIVDEAIELHKIDLPRAGTTVRVRLPKTTLEKFRRPNSETWEKKWMWDWYFLRDPSVERKLSVKNPRNWVMGLETLEPEYFIPGANESNLPAQWHRIHHEDFEDIHWHFPKENNKGKLFCNGIKIPGKYGSGPTVKKELAWLFSLKQPLLSVFDPFGKLPINLARSELTRELPFERELLEDIYRDMIAFLIDHTPPLPLHDSRTAKAYSKISYAGTDSHDWFWTTPQGLSLAHKWFLRHISPPNLYLSPRITDFPFRIEKQHAYVASFDLFSAGFSSYDGWVRFALTGTGFGSRWLEGLKVNGRRLLISAKYENRIKEFKAIPKTFLARIVEEWRDENWLVLSTKDCPPAGLPFRDLASQVQPELFTMLAEWYLPPVDEAYSSDTDDDSTEDYLEPQRKLEKKPSVLVPVWKDLIGKPPIITYDRTKRSKSFG